MDLSVWSCPFYLKNYIIAPNDITQFHGFEYLLYADVPQDYILSLDLDLTPN